MLFSSKIAILVSVTLVGKIPNAMFPGISSLFEENDSTKLIEIFNKISILSIRLGIVFGLSYLLINKQFVHLRVGEEYFAGYTLTQVFVLWIIVESFLRGISTFIYASSDLFGWSVISLIEALLNVSISMLLVGQFGMVGIAFGTLISRLITSFIYIPWKICELLETSFESYLLNSVIKTIIYSFPLY